MTSTATRRHILPGLTVLQAGPTQAIATAPISQHRHLVQEYFPRKIPIESQEASSLPAPCFPVRLQLSRARSDSNCAKRPVLGIVERIEASAHPEWRPLRLVARQASERISLRRSDLRFLPAQPSCQGVRTRI